MKYGALRIGVAAGLSGLLAAPGLAATPPEPGTYAVLFHVEEAKVTGAGSCVDPIDTSFTGYFEYPGPNKTGAVTRAPAVSLGVNGMFLLTYPRTPSAGRRQWSGRYDFTLKPGPASAGGSGEFTYTFDFVDGKSFVAVLTERYPTTEGGTCHARFTQEFNRLGP